MNLSMSDSKLFKTPPLEPAALNKPETTAYFLLLTSKQRKSVSGRRYYAFISMCTQRCVHGYCPFTSNNGGRILFKYTGMSLRIYTN